MYDDLRQVTITGGITQDVQLAYTQSGTAVLKLNIGCSESKKNNQGSYDKKSHYFEVVVWSKYAEALANKLHKGSKIAVSGELDFQQWQHEGQNRSKVVINARSVKIYGDNQQGNVNNGAQSYNKPSNQGSGNFEDDIPFDRSDLELR